MESAKDRLRESQNRDGGWGYAAGRASAAEPTAWASLALSGCADPREASDRGLDFLADIQRTDGGVPAIDIKSAPNWTTAVAMLAWTHSPASSRFQRNVNRGADWLLSHAGKAVPFNAQIYGHDTSLIGWSWVDGTHSWVEPTSYAILALRTADRGDHPRVLEGRRLLQDRTIPGGGWNYGNAKMFGSALRPFPGTTGVALMALTGRSPDQRIEESLAFLERELARVRSPISLAWGLMALTAWQRRPVEADAWLAETFDRFSGEPCNPLHESLLLLASHDPCPLLPQALRLEAVHG